jgi:hypothetical protein
MVPRLGSAALIAFGAAFIAAPAAADDCTKIENPLAYNACLAKQGPEWHGTHGVPVPADADTPKGQAAGAWQGPGRVRSTMQFGRNRHGRMVVEFAIGGEAAASSKRKTR